MISVLVAIAVIGIVVALFLSAAFARKLADTPDVPQVPTQASLSPILLLSAVEISARLRRGELSSVVVVRTFVEHIRRVNPYLNAMVFDRFDEAMAEAAEADRALAAIRRGDASKDPGWLLGVPCTVKECMQVTGCPNTSGHPKRRHVRATEDSPVVARVRACGAIVLGLTNTSELCMWMESFNTIYGTTCNPYDTRRLVGGSSGGEGAAIAAMFAPFGIGSDIGGSIRMPAFFNGIFGHKPSTRLVPNRGQHPTVQNTGHFLMTTGPMCRHAEDLLPLLHVMADGGFLEDKARFPPCPRPPKALPVLRPTADSANFSLRIAPGGGSKKRPLRVFAIEDLGLLGVHVSPSQIAAVNMCAEHLASALGAEVHIINFRDKSRCTGGSGIPEGWRKVRQTLDIWSSLIGQPGGEMSFKDMMSLGYELPLSPLRELGRWLVGRSEHTIPAIGLMLFEAIEGYLLQPRKRAAFCQMGRDLQAAFERELGDEGVVICPTYPIPAPKHFAPIYYPVQFQYTALFNALQLPATAVPVWEPVGAGRSGVAPSPFDARRGHVREALAPDFHLPKGVQVVGSWGQDALCIAVAAELERLLGGYKPPHWAHFATH